MAVARHDGAVAGGDGAVAGGDGALPGPKRTIHSHHLNFPSEHVRTAALEGQLYIWGLCKEIYS